MGSLCIQRRVRRGRGRQRVHSEEIDTRHGVKHELSSRGRTIRLPIQEERVLESKISVRRQETDGGDTIPLRQKWDGGNGKPSSRSRGNNVNTKAIKFNQPASERVSEKHARGDPNDADGKPFRARGKKTLHFSVSDRVANCLSQTRGRETHDRAYSKRPRRSLQFQMNRVSSWNKQGISSPLRSHGHRRLSPWRRLCPRPPPILVGLCRTFALDRRFRDCLYTLSSPPEVLSK